MNANIAGAKTLIDVEASCFSLFLGSARKKNSISSRGLIHSDSACKKFAVLLLLYGPVFTPRMLLGIGVQSRGGHWIHGRTCGRLSIAFTVRVVISCHFLFGNCEEISCHIQEQEGGPIDALAMTVRARSLFSVSNQVKSAASKGATTVSQCSFRKSCLFSELPREIEVDRTHVSVKLLAAAEALIILSQLSLGEGEVSTYFNSKSNR